MRNKINNLEARLREKDRFFSRANSMHATQMQTVTDEAMRVKRAAQERENQYRHDIAELKRYADKGKGRATMEEDADGDDEEDSDDDEEDGLFNIPSSYRGEGTDEEGVSQVCSQSRAKIVRHCDAHIFILIEPWHGHDYGQSGGGS